MRSQLTVNLPLVAESVNGIKKLRALILELAIRGKLCAQEPNDEPVDELLKQISKEKAQLKKSGEVRTEKALLPIYDEDKIFEAPAGWQWIRLGNLVLKSEAGWSPTCESRGRVGDEWGVLKVSAVSWGEFKPNENKALPANLVPRAEYEVMSGDFLISRANTAELVARSVVVGECPRHLMLSDKIVRLNIVTAVNKRFCHLVNSSAFARKYYQESAGGTSSSMKNVSRDQILNLIFPLPPLSEQYRIVAKVDELIALCDRLEAQQSDAESAHIVLVKTLLDTLTQSKDQSEVATNWERIKQNFDTLFTTEASVDVLKQTLLQLAVMGRLIPHDPSDEPATKIISRIKDELKVATRKPSKQSDNLKESEICQPFDVPQGWAWTTLGSIADVGTGKTPPREQTEFFRGSIPWVTSGLTSESFVMSTDENLTEVAVKECNLRIYPKHTLIVAMYGQGKTRGQVSELLIEATVNQACAAIVLHGTAFRYNGYIKLYFEKIYDEIRQKSAGGAQPNLNVQKIKETAIPLPPLLEQQRIVEKVQELSALCERLKIELRNSSALQTVVATTLIQQALSEDRSLQTAPSDKVPMLT